MILLSNWFITVWQCIKMNKRCTINIMPLNSIPAVNTNKHNVASPWCLWVAWSIRLLVHFSLKLSYSTVRKKAFVLSRSYRLGYTECCMSYGDDFNRALRLKMFVNMCHLPDGYVAMGVFLILINALLWTAPTRKATLNNRGDVWGWQVGRPPQAPLLRGPRGSGLSSSLWVCQAIFSGKLEMLIHALFNH